MKKHQRIIDISLPIYMGMATYPGNPSVRIIPRRGKTSDHSEITFGSHTGTHLDAPRHVFRKGAGVDRVQLDRLIGKCRVLDMMRVKKAITPEDFKNYDIKKGERILVKTKNSLRGFKKFYSDYVYLDGDAAAFLARKGTLLFGIDSLSVKERGSADNRPHTELLKKNIPILEGLNLSRVKPGIYTLIALPLSFKNLDGAPARAVLM